MKHTPEPWRIDGKTPYVLKGGIIIARLNVGLLPEIQSANAERIVECVNACEGIENPKEFISNSLNVADQLLEALKAKHELLEQLQKAAYIIERHLSFPVTRGYHPETIKQTLNKYNH